jgi:hypothetical protein
MAQGEPGVLEPDGWSVLLPIAGLHLGDGDIDNDLAEICRRGQIPEFDDFRGPT